MLVASMDHSESIHTMGTGKPHSRLPPHDPWSSTSQLTTGLQPSQGDLSSQFAWKHPGFSPEFKESLVLGI